MSLKSCQNQVDKWIEQYKLGYFDPHEIVTRLAEETGEVAREVSHLHGPKKRKDTEEKGNLGEELADVIFIVICMANSHDIDLDEHFQKVIDEKCYGRDKDRFDKK